MTRNLPKMRPFGDPQAALMQCLHCGQVMGQTLLLQVAHSNVCDGSKRTLALEEALTALGDAQRDLNDLGHALYDLAEHWEMNGGDDANCARQLRLTISETGW